jgi:hypothetical protein
LIGRAAITLAMLCLAAAGAGIYFSTHLKTAGGAAGHPARRRRGTEPPSDLRQSYLLLAFAGLGLLARYRRDASLAFISFALFPLLLLATNLSAIGLVFNAKSARQLAQQFPALPPQTELACLECYPCGVAVLSGAHSDLDHR